MVLYLLLYYNQLTFVITQQCHPGVFIDVDDGTADYPVWVHDAALTTRGQQVAAAAPTPVAATSAVAAATDAVAAAKTSVAEAALARWLAAVVVWSVQLIWTAHLDEVS